MDLQLRIVLPFVTVILCFQLINCDKYSNGSGTLRWTCVCHNVPIKAPENAPNNCSTSCDCIPVKRGPSQGTWNCSCGSESDVAPHAPGNIEDASCFTSCNCTSGTDSLGKTQTAGKHMTGKAVVIIILCSVLTAISFLASAAYCFYLKDRHLHQSSRNLSEKEVSWNSSTNLISNKSASFPQSKTFFCNPIPGIILKLSSLLSVNREFLPGILLQFSYAELEKATDNFSDVNLVGVGGSSNVYRGQLKEGRIVAVKKLRAIQGSEVDDEFLYEIKLLSRLNHRHVVPLLGYCTEYRGRQLERLLVFEYMYNGNLRECLDTREAKEPMDWETRVRIALGTARGLEYLHEAAAPRILHRDIKSTNILLDDRFRAKITDLGMAKSLMSDDFTSCPSSPARMLGTFGYFAPEYAIVGKASLKSDVFSFGVVVLELITGRRPIYKSKKGDESLVMWANSRLHNSKQVVSELPDPLLKGKFTEEEMQIMAHLSRECLQWDPDLRPNMSEVVQILLMIDPDKSGKRILPTNYSVGSYSCRVRSPTGVATPELPLERRDSSRAASGRWYAQFSLPNTVMRNLCHDPEKDTDACLSAEYMDRLVLLTSSARSCRYSDDETVDLMEPRFESFLQANAS